MSSKVLFLLSILPAVEFPFSSITCGFSYLPSGDRGKVYSPYRVYYSSKLPPGIEYLKILEAAGQIVRGQRSPLSVKPRMIDRLYCRQPFRRVDS